MDFLQTFINGASWDDDELIRFWDLKVKGQGFSEKYSFMILFLELTIGLKMQLQYT